MRGRGRGGTKAPVQPEDGATLGIRRLKRVADEGPPTVGTLPVRRNVNANRGRGRGGGDRGRGGRGGWGRGGPRGRGGSGSNATFRPSDRWRGNSTHTPSFAGGRSTDRDSRETEYRDRDFREDRSRDRSPPRAAPPPAHLQRPLPPRPASPPRQPSPSHLRFESSPPPPLAQSSVRYSPSQPTSVISISDDEETAVAAMDVPAGTAARVQGATDRIGSEGVTPDPPRPPRFKPRNHNVRENDPAPPPVLEREPSPPPPEPPKFKPRNHNPRKNDPQPNPTPPPPLYLHQHSTTSSIPPNNPSQNISNHEPIPIPSSSVQEDVKPDISTLETAESESSSSREGSPSKEGVMWIKTIDLPQDCFAANRGERARARMRLVTSIRRDFQAQGKIVLSSKWRPDGFAVDWCLRDYAAARAGASSDDDFEIITVPAAVMPDPIPVMDDSPPPRRSHLPEAPSRMSETSVFDELEDHDLTKAGARTIPLPTEYLLASAQRTDAYLAWREQVLGRFRSPALIVEHFVTDKGLRIRWRPADPERLMQEGGGTNKRPREESPEVQQNIARVEPQAGPSRPVAQPVTHYFQPGFPALGPPQHPTAGVPIHPPRPHFSATVASWQATLPFTMPPPPASNYPTSPIGRLPNLSILSSSPAVDPPFTLPSRLELPTRSPAPTFTFGDDATNVEHSNDTPQAEAGPTTPPTPLTPEETLAQLQTELNSLFDRIDRWMRLCEDFPERTEQLQRQIERTEKRIFELQNRMDQQKRVIERRSVE